ncbi:MAG: aminoglycoside phosphotransferase family protein, partial [Acidimicrobiia bacterium]
SSIPKQFRKTRIEKWTPPKSLKFDAFVEDVIATIQRELPWALEAERAFGHGDFHPGNLLWRATRLTGVIDWSHVAINPRAYEVSYCRADLAVLLGPRAADRFLEAYEGRLGRRLGEDLSIWDLMCGLNAIAWGHFWMIGYAEQGRVDLTVRRTKQRARAFTSRALSRLAGS